jgi:hypothetical protein
LPPVPSRLFSLSMLLPVSHDVLSWCTFALIECQGDFFMALLSSLRGFSRLMWGLPRTFPILHERRATNGHDTPCGVIAFSARRAETSGLHCYASDL